MTKSGYQDKVIKNLLAITLYVPLIIAIIASSMKLYDFIYPATEGNNVYEQASNLRYDLTNRLFEFFQNIFLIKTAKSNRSECQKAENITKY